jgi:hypothetical protein
VTQASPRARCGARPFLSWLSHQPPPESMPRGNITPTSTATQRWYFATFSI